MPVATAPYSATSCVLQPVSLAETTGAELTGHAMPAMSSGSATGHDATLLVVSLEQIAARQAAIEWLLDANLLCLCLV